MSWFKSTLVAMGLMASLAGCGFHPMYGQQAGQQAPASAELNFIRVSAIEDRVGQQVRNSLVEMITPRGEPRRPRYLLSVVVNQSSGAITASRDGSATLGNLTLIGSFSLREMMQDGATLFSGKSRSVSSFRYYGPRYGSVTTERDAEDRAISEITYDIRNQLAAYFSSRPAGFKPEINQ